MHDHVGHFWVLWDDDAEGAQTILIEIRQPVFTNPSVYKFAARRESRTKLGNDLLRQNILPAGRELNLDTGGESKRNLLRITRPRELLGECCGDLNQGFIQPVVAIRSLDY